MGTPRPKLIGLYSSVPQSGKSEVAKYLDEQHGYVRYSFADPMKRMLETLYDGLGLKGFDCWELLWGIRKGQPVGNGIDKTSRYLMQTLGTEWGRNLIDPDLWVKATMAKVDREVMPVVIDDVRFPSEYKAIKDRGGIMVRVWRDAPMFIDHCSEGSLDRYTFDNNIINMGTIELLHKVTKETLFGNYE